MYNEEQNVDKLLKALSHAQKTLNREFTVHVIFVDDGSTDNTVNRIRGKERNLKLVLLEHATNRGPGAAFGTAFDYLQGRLQADDWLVTMEGDNTSSLETLHHMLVRRKEGYDVILASPYLYGGGFSQVEIHRLFLSHIANGLVKILLGIRGIQTFSCFFRLYSGRVILRLQGAYGGRIIKSPGFECMVEMLAKLIKIKARISEVETKIDWNDRVGRTKMNVMKTIAGYFRLLAARNRIFHKTWNGCSEPQ